MWICFILDLFVRLVVFDMWLYWWEFGLLRILFYGMWCLVWFLILSVVFFIWSCFGRICFVEFCLFVLWCDCLSWIWLMMFLWLCCFKICCCCYLLSIWWVNMNSFLLIVMVDESVFLIWNMICLDGIMLRLGWDWLVSGGCLSILVSWFRFIWKCLKSLCVVWIVKECWLYFCFCC